MNFAGKIVLITGASSGIGLSIAIKFAKHNAQLALVGRNQERLRETAIQCENASGLKPLEIIADISQDQDARRIIKETIDKFQRLDILINNAGILRLGGYEAGVETYDQVMATNARGTFHLTTLAAPHLIATKGNIVNMSSVASKKPMPVFVSYSMSKAALDMMTKCLALELGPQGVRVNAVNPGPVHTDIFKKAGMGATENEALYENFASMSPLKRYAVGTDVANLVAFLASDELAATITGTSNVIDCGIHYANVNM